VLEPEVLLEDEVGECVSPVEVPLDEEEELWPVILGPRPAVKARGTMFVNSRIALLQRSIGGSLQFMVKGSGWPWSIEGKETEDVNAV
jgi:hypothetical protein